MKIIQRTLPLLCLVLLVGCRQTPKSLAENHFAKLKNGEISAAKKQLCSLQYNDGIAIPLTSYTLTPAKLKLKDSVKYHQVDATVSTTYQQGGTPYIQQHKDPLSGFRYRENGTLQGGPLNGQTVEQTRTVPDRIIEEQIYPAVPITKITIEVWKPDDFYAEVVKLEQASVKARKAQEKADANSRLQRINEERGKQGMPPLSSDPSTTVGTVIYSASLEPKRKDFSTEPLCIVYSANWSNSILGKFVPPSGNPQFVLEKKK
jgi:hypothetical protein